MFDILKKKWTNRILIEGEKEAMFLAQNLGLPEVNPNFDGYPVDMVLPKKRTFWQAVKYSVYLGERCVYNMIVKNKD